MNFRLVPKSVTLNDVMTVITGSIARSAMRRYLIYSEADFEVFSPRRGDTLLVLVDDGYMKQSFMSCPYLPCGHPNVALMG